MAVLLRETWCLVSASGGERLMRVIGCYTEAGRSHVCFTEVHGGRCNVDWPVFCVGESNLTACVEIRQT